MSQDLPSSGRVFFIANNVEAHFHQDKNTVKDKCHVSEVQIPDGGDAVRDGYDGRDTKSGFGVQGNPQGQQQKSCRVIQPPVKKWFFHNAYVHFLFSFIYTFLSYHTIK